MSASPILLSCLAFFVALASSGCTASGPSAPSDPSPAAPSPSSPSSGSTGGTSEPDDPAITPVTGEINGGCAPDGAPGHQTKRCKVDGVEVAFDVDVPERCVSRVCGVILDVHGWSMNGPMQGLHTRLSELTKDERFILVHPTAPGSPPSWGKGKYPFSQDFAYDDTVWGFAVATQTRFHADDKRLHITGFSQGAMMSFRLAFAHAERIASIAPISGPSGFADPSPFGGATPTNDVPSRKVPILYIHGTKDKELEFDKNAIVLRDEIVKTYGLGVPDTLRSETSLRAYAYRVGPGAIFEFWEHDYATTNLNTVGGHCVPGPIEAGDGVLVAKPPSARPFRCVDPNQTLDAGTEILRFFKEHPLP